MPILDKAKKKEYDKAYHLKNKDKRYEAYKAWLARNKESSLKYQREYQKEYQLGYGRDRYYARSKEKYATDIQFRLGKLIRSRIGKIKRNGSAVKYLGCSMEAFKEHIEKQFLPGMSWDNRREWHLDHIVPLSAFDLTDTRQMMLACNYMNMRPLWAADNIRKGKKFDLRELEALSIKVGLPISSSQEDDLTP